MPLFTVEGYFNIISFEGQGKSYFQITVSSFGVKLTFMFHVMWLYLEPGGAE